ncbi:MAG: PH domain-containing protein [Clostridiales bacterium]|jgi:uncharacterized membrane protein YdbT with pleckstrin-like domain|nr:PH domain-containing protein [Clostridiales bacterium]
MGKESFVKKTLDDDEKIIAMARLTRWKFLDEVLWGILFACVIIAAIFVIKKDLVTIIVASILTVIWLIMSSKDIVYLNLTILGVTTRKVVFKSGFMRTKSVDIPLRNIDNVQVYYSFIGKIFNFGKIRIESRSEPIEVNWVYNPTRFKNLIDRAAQGYVTQRKIVQ